MPQLSESAQERHIVVGTFQRLQQAHFAQSRLDAENIESHLNDEHITHYDIFYTPIFGGVKLVVMEEDAERAREIVAAMEADLFEMYQSREKQCPNCDSENIRKRILKYPSLVLVFFGPFLFFAGGVIIFVVVVLLLAGLLRHRTTNRCNDCGQTF